MKMKMEDTIYQENLNLLINGGYTEIIWLLAGGDITKMKEIYKLNCHEFLYWAAYMIDKRKVEVARLEKK
jgi:hypothetical protein